MTGPEKTVSPSPSRTVTLGAYPCPLRNSLVPSTSSGWFGAMLVEASAPPSVR